MSTQTISNLVSFNQPVAPLESTERFHVADLFCGCLGFSSGADRALARLGYAKGEVNHVAVNHWKKALETGEVNHPHVTFYHEDLADTHLPLRAFPDGKVHLLMASPSCVHHSRARGGRPTADQDRVDPWYVIPWLTQLDVDVLLIENVPEFKQWGPIDPETRKPIKARRGEYFEAWCNTIVSLGYELEHKVLICADYGDVTTRQRFFLIARKDGRSITWPAPTHAKRGTIAHRGGLKPWRAAAEVIDWTDKGKSIFGRKKSLAEKTHRRILAGAEKYAWPRSFANAIRRDLLGEFGPWKESTYGELLPFAIGQHGGSVARSVEEPMMTIATEGAISIVNPHLTIYRNHGDALSVDEPMPTITAGGTHIGLTTPIVFPLTHGTDPDRTRSANEDPLPTITGANRGELAVATPSVKPVLLPQCSDADRVPRRQPRTHDIDEPLPTITGSGGHAIATPMIAPYYGQGSGTTCTSTEDPLPTVTTKPRFGLVQPFLVANFNERPGQAPRTHDVYEPFPTVTHRGAGDLVQGFIVETADGSFLLDITHRMLQPDELAKGQGFKNYRFRGNKTEIVKQVGNAVPGETSEALVYAALSGDGKLN